MQNNTSRHGRRYDWEFKQSAIALVKEGRSMTEVARDLGVTLCSLSRWVHAGDEVTARASGESEPERELRRLRQENAYLRQQRDILKKALGILSAGMPKDVSVVMKELSREYSIAPLAETLEVSKSGFYADQRKLQGRRSQQDQQLLGWIEKLFIQSRRTYGSPRLCAALRAQGCVCGKNRVARLMRVGGLRARQKRAFRPKTTLSQHPLALARNWLAKVPAPDRPNQVWQSDITYLPTAQGWLYLAVTLDASSRKVLGWATSESLHTTLVTEALERAWQTRRPSPGLLHHSDRGFQYANHRFRRLLQSFGATASMSRKANCYDNALVESFFSTLKTECFDQPLPATKQQTRLLLFDYIEGFYNRRRLHSALGYLSPLQFENRFL